MNIAGIILAGGRSSRMEGRDKALLRLGSTTLVAHGIDRLAPQVSRLVVSANGDPARFCLGGIEIIADADDSHAGPLAGILAGLRWVANQSPHSQALVSVAVDAPFFPTNLVERLAAATAELPGTVAVAARAGTRHPTFGLWPLAVTEALAHFLDQGGRKVGAFIETQPHVVIDFPAPEGFDPFFNINTPADLAEAEAVLSRQP